MAKKTKPPVVPPSEPRSPRALALCVTATAALLIADLASKEWAEEQLSAARAVALDTPVCMPDEHDRIDYRRVTTQPVVLIEGYLELRYTENCGAAFGFMRSAPPLARKVVFGTAAVAASIGLFVMFFRGRGGRLFALSVPLIVSGALGNLVDRVRYGYVVDFIRFHWQDAWSYPTFNIADIGITVGVILLVLDGFKDAQRAREADVESARSQTVSKPADERK